MAADGDDAIRFAEKLLALLDTGRFTATYKFATLLALIDVCVAAVDEHGEPPATVPAKAVGRRAFELFWPQALPYAAPDGSVVDLRHSTQTGDIVSRVAEVRRRHRFGPGMTLEAARSLAPRDLAALEDHVVTTIVRMPLPKLQRFGPGAAEEDRFLYDFGWPDEVAPSRVHAPDFDDRLHLRPGVGGWLVRLGGVLRPIVQQRWAAFVADRSSDVVEQSWLDDFLFGARRVALDPVRDPLLDLQRGACFYCGDGATRGHVDVDHFIPWSRHPDNGLHNLVVAHRRCNNAKRDALAAVSHVEHWLERNATVDLAALAPGWPAHAPRTLGAARATYLWLPEGTPLWAGVGLYTRTDPADVARVFAGA